MGNRLLVVLLLVFMFNVNAYARSADGDTGFQRYIDWSDSASSEKRVRAQDFDDENDNFANWSYNHAASPDFNGLFAHNRDFEIDSGVSTDTVIVIKTGKLRNDSNVIFVAVDTFTLSGTDTTWYIQLSDTGTIDAQSNGFSGNHIPLHEIYRTDTGIRIDTDVRALFQVSSNVFSSLTATSASITTLTTTTLTSTTATVDTITTDAVIYREKTLAPATPGAGTGILYTRDNAIFYINDAGQDANLTAGDSTTGSDTLAESTTFTFSGVSDSADVDVSADSLNAYAMNIAGSFTTAGGAASMFAILRVDGNTVNQQECRHDSGDGSTVAQLQCPYSFTIPYTDTFHIQIFATPVSSGLNVDGQVHVFKRRAD